MKPVLLRISRSIQGIMRFLMQGTELHTNNVLYKIMWGNQQSQNVCEDHKRQNFSGNVWPRQMSIWNAPGYKITIRKAQTTVWQSITGVILPAILMRCYNSAVITPFIYTLINYSQAHYLGHELSSLCVTISLTCIYYYAQSASVLMQEVYV